MYLQRIGHLECTNCTKPLCCLNIIVSNLQEAARLAAAAAPPIAAPAVSSQPASNALRTAPPPKFAPAPPPRFPTSQVPLSDSQVTHQQPLSCLTHTF